MKSIKTLVILSLFVPTIAFAGFFDSLKSFFNPTVNLGASVVQTFSGGTGTSTQPAKGSLLSGFTATQYGVLAVGTNGKCLVASSTATFGTSWEDCASGGSGITSLNGETGATQTFATSSDTNIHLRITSAGDIHTFTPFWNGTLDFSSRTNATASSGIVFDGDSIANNGVLALVAGTNITLSSATGTVTINSTASGGSTTTINGVDGPTFTFATSSGLSFFRISTSSQTVTFNLSEKLEGIHNIATTTGLLIQANGTNWAGVTTSSLGFAQIGAYTTTTILAGVGISVDSPTGNVTITNSAPNFNTTTTIFANSPISVDSPTGNVTITLSTSTGSGLVNVSGLKLGLGGNAAQTCSGTDKVSSITATGTITCAADEEGAGAFTTTTINGLSATAYTFATSSGLSFFQIATSAPGTVTFNVSKRLENIHGLATTTGNLIIGTSTPQGWTALAVGTDSKVLMASSTAPNGLSYESVVTSAVAGTGISVSGATGAVTFTNTAPNFNTTTTVAGINSAILLATSTGLNFFTISTSSQTITFNVSNKLFNIHNLATTTGGIIVASSSPNGWGLLAASTTGSFLISSSTAPNGLAYAFPSICTSPFILENPTSTTGTIDNGPGTIVHFFQTTSTITSVRAVNTKTGDTASYNLTYNTSRNSATSTFGVFSSQQTVTSTTTLTQVAPTASSTPGKDTILRVSFSAASSSQFGLQICYREN